MSSQVRWLSSDEAQTKNEWVTKELETSTFSLRAASTIGGPRSRYTDNQDVVCIVEDEKQTRIVVVDGAGSTDTGRRAAIICAETTQDLALSLETAYLKADERIRAETRQSNIFDPKTSGYGAVVGVDIDLQTPSIQLAYWGDCRAVLLRQGNVERIATTVPQNALFDEVLQGRVSLEGYYAAEGPSYLSGGLGLSDLSGINPPVGWSFIPEARDLLLLGSDGVWDQISDYEVAELWNAHAEQSETFFTALKAFIFARNNATEPFSLRIGADRAVEFLPEAADNTSIVQILFF